MAILTLPPIKDAENVTPLELAGIATRTGEQGGPPPGGTGPTKPPVVTVPIFDGGSVRTLIAQPAVATDFGFARPWYDASWANQMRVIADIAAAGSTAAELFAERSADGSAWTEPGVSAAPIPVIINAVGARKGSWIAIPTASAADLIWRVRGRSGNGIASPSVSKVHLQFRNAPLAPPATPPSGDLGSPIHDLNAETLALTHSDNQDVTTWPDDSVSNLDGAVVGGIAPKFRTSLWPGGKPCVQWSGANNKIAFSPPTNSSFTHYVVASGIDGGDVATVLEGNGYPKGKGISAIGTSEMGGFVNTHVWFPTYENVPDTWDMSTPHIYRFAFDYGIGHWWLFVDGVLVADNDCPPQITESTQMWVGDYGTGLGLSMLLARELCYDAPYSTAGLNSVETALKATWGTP